MGDAMSAVPQALGAGWTYQDILALPEGVPWWCYEIVDGSLVVTPSADVPHERVNTRLRALLWNALPDGSDLLGPMSVGIAPTYLVPDLMVVIEELIEGRSAPLPPEAVPLVIEIVSPGSRTMDRVTKPVKYAQAGIPFYWRVEVEPQVSLTAYRLDGGQYGELGTWGPGETARIDQPFPVTVPIDVITPRRLRPTKSSP